MNTTLPPIALGALLMALAGCASTPKSKAYQIAEAAEIHHALRDAPTDADVDAFHTFANISDALQIQGDLIGATNLPPGISPGVDIAFRLLSILERSSTPKATRHHYLRGAFFVWMPRDLHPDPDAAKTALKTQILAAAIKAIPEGFAIENPASLKAFTGQSEPPPTRYRVTGGVCDQRDCSLGLYALHALRPLDAPEVLGGYPAFAWIRSDCLFGLWFKKRGETNVPPPFDLFAYYQRVSYALPEWIYLFVPPEYGVTPTPIMLNQGKPSFFIQPAKQASVSP